MIYGVKSRWYTHRLKMTIFPRLASVLAAVVMLVGTAISQSSKPDSVEAARLNNIGAGYMNQQSFEKALETFQRAAKLDPGLQVAKLNQGIALLNMAKVDPAGEILEAAVKRDPQDAHAWYNLGLLYKNSSAPERGIDAFRHVIDIDSTDADTWYFLGSAYAQQKRFAEARDAFEHALKLNPFHASAQFGLARSYQQSGDPAKAKEGLQRFQYVTQNKLGTPVSLAYGEQGRYSLVEQSPGQPVKVPQQIPVRFVDVTAHAGLTGQHPGPSATGIGTGACFLDFDGDGRPDLFLANNGPTGGLSLFHNLGNGKFEDVTRKAGLDPTLHAITCLAGDYDNDGASDLVVSLSDRVMLLHNEKNGTFRDVTAAAGLHDSPANLALAFVDYDHDGDIDLYVGHSSGGTDGGPRRNVMFRNNGNGTFTDVSETVGLEGPEHSTGAIATDFNNDRAVDLFVVGRNETKESSAKGLPVYGNPREGKFTELYPWSGDAPSNASAVATLDFDHDGWMDFALATDRGLQLWRNVNGKTLERIELPHTDLEKVNAVAALDFDNDGWQDIAALGLTKDGKGAARLFRNLGPDGWKDVTADVGLDKIALTNPSAILTADFDGDGATDLLITQQGASAILLKNEGATKNHWLRLSLKGLNDNKSAIGTKVEVFAGANRQKFEIVGSSGYLGQNSSDIVIGLGETNQADVVRLLWPTGVLQDELEVAADSAKSILEIDRRGSSCPTLFAWNGTDYELVGDMLGAGVVGHWVAPGQRNVSRPVEYIKLNRSLREKDGKLSFRFMEPLEESVYLDRVRLLAIDHPASLDVFPNEYFASNPPYPPFKVVVSQGAQPPVAAKDNHGHNVLADLLAHRYFGDFKLLPFMGYAEPHSLDLDLGQGYDGGPLWLLMHGEIEYFSATSMYAASQAGLEAISPFVEALDADGKWVRVMDDLGFPAGGARTMTADLSGKLPRGTRQIRITTNLQIYWDSILIDRTAQAQPTRATSVPLAAADLDFHGFPLKIENQPPGNVEYIYAKASATGPYTRPAGNYTRYGDVLPLLNDLDDRQVVFGSGDEVKLEFDPSSLPLLPQDWSRDYFFVAEGYEKDMDFYAAEGNTVNPLPFASMTSYPYPGQSFPSDDFHLNYLLEFNTRYMSGNEAQGYEFRYPLK